jgi:hypothetical protein
MIRLAEMHEVHRRALDTTRGISRTPTDVLEYVLNAKLHIKDEVFHEHSFVPTTVAKDEAP